MKNNSAEAIYKRFRRLSVWLALTAVLAVIALVTFICAFAVAALAAYKNMLMTVSGITVGVAVLSMVFLGVAISMLPTATEPEGSDSIDISAENIDTDGSTFASNAVVSPDSTKTSVVPPEKPQKRVKPEKVEQPKAVKPAEIEQQKPVVRTKPAKVQENSTYYFKNSPLVQSGEVQQHAEAAPQYTEVASPPPDVHAAPRVNYIPSQNVYDFVNVGKVQTIEEKFDQIGKMDQAQFVIYFAKLFSIKGYNVKLTPVADNFGIDMLVEKAGTAIAVSCVRSQIVLSADALAAAINGRNHYGTYHAMVLTNTFFDRSAVELAKKEGLSLVDREVLIDEFL
jgi:HJR/Mrr/RecB family endonuclease